VVTTTDWDEIRTAYVTGELSLRKLARQFGVSQAQVFQRAREEGWVRQREQFRSKSAADGQSRAAEEASEAAALIFKISRLLLEKFYRALQEDGIQLSPHHAAQWAQIMLALEQAGRTPEPQRIIVKWVADEGDQDSVRTAPETT
jgi:transposase-like protein